MILSQVIKKSIEESVLCWLATASSDNQPNVSPKEIFCHFEDEYFLVANIASPNTIKNIKANSNICVSVLDILIQKGYQLKGNAQIIEDGHQEYDKLKEPLYAMAGEKFPFNSLTKIKIESAKAILAPSYLLYPDTTTESQQIENARKTYNL